MSFDDSLEKTYPERLQQRLNQLPPRKKIRVKLPRSGWEVTVFEDEAAQPGYLEAIEDLRDITLAGKKDLFADALLRIIARGCGVTDFPPLDTERPTA